MGAQPFLSGKGTRFKCYLNNQPTTFSVKTWSIKEIVVDVKDDVNGEDRARPDVITELYDANFECYDDSTASMLEQLLTSTTNDDNFNPPMPNSIGVLFTYQDGGTQKAFVMNGCTRPPMDVKSSGRVERIMHTCHVRAQYVTQTQTT